MGFSLSALFPLTVKEQGKASVRSRADSPPVAQSPVLEKTHPGWSALNPGLDVNFVANLRAVGCPERTIINIMEGFAFDRLSLNIPRSLPLVRRFTHPEEMGRLRSVAVAENKQRIDSILYGELGLKHLPRTPGPLFDQDEEAKILQAHLLFPKKRLGEPSGYAEAQDTNRVSRINLLSQTFNPTKLLYYKLDREGDAQRVANFLRGLAPSEAEFLDVARLIDGKDITLRDGNFAREVEQGLTICLAPERVRFLKDMRRPEFQSLFRFGASHQLERSVIDMLVRLRMSWSPPTSSAYAASVTSVLSGRASQDFLNDARIHPATN